jgi:hypothetical protein
MNGMAGTGKTTIACSLCSELERSELLGASFFCSRLLPDCQDITRIVPTIAYQLARHSIHFQSALCRVLVDDPDIGSRHFLKQFEKLVCEPLVEVKEAVPVGLTIVIDALDECVNRDGAQLILDALFRYAINLPVKFFVTCRPEPGIFEKVRSQDNQIRSLLHLHDIECSLVQADIEVYLKAELSPASLPQAQIKLLASRAGNLFIYAATAVRYIQPGGSANSLRRMKAMLDISSDSSSKQHERIDVLYAAVVQNALKNEELEPWEVEAIQIILHTVICVREPMTIETLAAFLKLDDLDGARSALESLRSVIHVSESSGLVSTLHASFPDYMLSAKRSGELFCDLSAHSQVLTRCCFETMLGSLRFNICGLESSFVFDEDVPDLIDRIHRAISPQLFYACRYWGDHLERSGAPDEFQSSINDFLSQRLLFWMEILNLKKCIDAGVPILSQAHAWLQVSVYFSKCQPEY